MAAKKSCDMKEGPKHEGGESMSMKKSEGETRKMMPKRKMKGKR